MFGTGKNEQPGFEIVSPKINLVENAAGTFTFTVYPGHPRYDDIDNTRAIISVMRDGDKEPLFRGRVLTTELGFYNEKQVTCEGELAFLCDTIQRPYSYTEQDERKTLAEMVKYYVDQYNSKTADIRKQIKVGDISKSGHNQKYIFSSGGTQEKILTAIKNELIEKHGGNIYITHSGNSAYLNYADSVPAEFHRVVSLPDYPKDGKKDDKQTAYKVTLTLDTKDANNKYNEVDVYGTGSYFIENYKFTGSKVTLIAGKAGTFVFTVPKTHRQYPKFDIKYKNNYIITVKEKSHNEPVFKGRFKSVVTAADGQSRTVTCEGELAYLDDVKSDAYNFSKYDYRQTPEWFFNKFIANHNSKVDSIGFKDERYKFLKGNVTVSAGDSGDNKIAVSDEDYTNTFDTIMQKLVNVYGGFLQVRHTDDGNYLDWLASPETANTQTIEFAENLIDINRTFDADGMGTVIIPLGQEDNEGKRVTIAGFDYSSMETDTDIVHHTDDDYIYSISAVLKYGWIEKTLIFDDGIYSSLSLYKLAKDYLNNVGKSQSIELSAVDLSAVNASFESFKLNQYVEITTAPHGITGALYTAKKMSISLVNPAANKITLGSETATITSQTSGSAAGTAAFTVSNGGSADSGDAVLKASKSYAEAQAQSALASAQKYADTLSDAKVDKQEGWSLITDEERQKLESVESGANKTITEDTFSKTSINPLTNGAVTKRFEADETVTADLAKNLQTTYNKLKDKTDNTAEGATELLNTFTESESTPQNEDYLIIKSLKQYTLRPFTALWNWIKSNLAKVATSGSYNDLSNKPTIPKAVTVDAELSGTSTNPLQNKIVKAKFDAVDSQISSLGIDNGNLWARVKTKADNTAEGATALLGNLSESNTAPGDEDEVIIKNLNQYTHRPLTKLFDWIKANLAKVATSGSYNDLTNKPDIPTVDSSFSESGTNAVAGNVILSALNSKANKTELQALSNQVSNKADAEHTHAYLPLAGGTMTGMLKTQSLYAPYERNKSDTNDNVPVSGAIALKSLSDLNTLKTFIGAVITTGGAWNNIMSIRHRNGVNDGANYGMYLRTALTTDNNLAWNKQISASSWIGERILLDSNNYKTYVTPANIGAAPSSHNHDSAYVKKTDVSAQPVLYTSTTTTTSATITGLFANYSLVWFQAVGSKTTHTHILPLAYLKSKGSLTFKDSGTPINILYVSDTQIRWFEYQGSGAETYSSATIVKIL